MPPRNQFLPEGIGRSGQTIIAVVPAGQTRQFNVAGSQFYFNECDAPLWCKTNVSSPAPFTVGRGENVPEGSFFKWIECDNRSGSDITIELYAGFGDSIDKRLNIVRERPESIQPIAESDTEIISSTTVSIPSASGVTFLGTPSATQLRRKALVVSNRDTAAQLQIRDALGNPGLAIFAGTSITLPISGEVEVYNATGGAISVYMHEIFYIMP